MQVKRETISYTLIYPMYSYDALYNILNTDAHSAHAGFFALLVTKSGTSGRGVGQEGERIFQVGKVPWLVSVTVARVVSMNV